MDNKDIERLGSQLDVSMAFLKAAKEVKAQEVERDKRIHEQAVKAAENRSKAEYEALSECDKRRGDLRFISGIITFGTGGRFADNRINQIFWR